MIEEQESEHDPLEESVEDNGERLQVLGHRLARLAMDQVGIRQRLEERWLADLEQYQGKYDVDTQERLKQAGGSQAFVNITRSKTMAAEARLSDMLFPSDDKNWGIQPTPNPELASKAKDFSIAGYDEADQEVTNADFAKQQMKLAKEKAEAMQTEIDDQLTEAHYHQVARDCIHSACLFGTGIIKGPIVVNRTRKAWKQLEGAVHVLEIEEEHRPGVEHVKVWDYFPDMSVSKKEECSFEFERRYVTRKDLIEMAKRPGYLKDQIRKIIAETPKQFGNGSNSYISRLRELSGLQANLNDNRYELWEYFGEIDIDDLRACGCEIEDDEFNITTGIVTFINDTVIKADLSPLETGESLYSVFCYEDDDTSVFGIGIPYLLRNEQKIVNAAWRMTLDNAALSTGPQIVVNRELVIPSDGAWDLKAKKIWWLADPEKRVEDVFHAFEINSHQAELTNIFDIARNMADDVTSLPMLAQGEQGDAPDTATGMSMLMNSANIVLRHVVKSFDDGITKPFIRRMYDWNMQYSNKEEIKGDFEVDARGSSALLVKETQTQALEQLLAVAQQPFYSEITKHPELYRKAVQSRHITPDDIVKTNDEIEAEKNKPSPEQQQQQAMFDLQMKEMQAKIDSIVAKAFETNMKGLYASIQGGQAAASMPGLMPVADSLAASGGFIDHNGAPIMVQSQQQAISPMQGEINPPAMGNPVNGFTKGIETVRNDL
jgi:hypothetical protein